MSQINRKNKKKIVLVPNENGIAEELQTIEELKEIAENKQGQIKSNSSFESSSESSDEVKPVRRKVYIERLKEE